MLEHAFVEQPILQHRFGKGFLEVGGFLAQLADVATAGLALSIPGQPLFPRFQKLLAPAVLHILVQALTAAPFSDTVLAAQAGQYNPNLLLRAELPASGPFDGSDQFIRFNCGVLCWFHHRSFHARR